MNDFIVETFGEYTPITYESCESIPVCDVEGYCSVETTCNDVIPPGLAGVNMEYVSNILIVIIPIYFIFRTLGAIICKSL